MPSGGSWSPKVRSGPATATSSETRFVEVYNSDLANTLGNCFNRITNMTQRYLGGVVADPGDSSSECQKVAPGLVARHLEGMERLALDDAATAALDLVRSIDVYIDRTRPFTLAKDPELKAEVGAILYHCAEAMRIASLMLWPFMPGRIETLWERIGSTACVEALAGGGTGSFHEWARWGGLLPGTPIAAGEALFPRHRDTA